MKKLILGALLLLSMISCTTEDAPYCKIIASKYQYTVPFTSVPDKYYVICTGDGQLPAFEVTVEIYNRYTFGSAQNPSTYHNYNGRSVMSKIVLNGKYYLICAGSANSLHIFEIDKIRYDGYSQIGSVDYAYPYFGSWFKVTEKVMIPGKLPTIEYNLVLSDNETLKVNEDEYNKYNEGETYCK